MDMDDPDKDAVDEQNKIQTIVTRIGVQTLVTRGLNEDLQFFHAEVASEVKAALNLYYPEAKEFVGETKISSREKYKLVARQLSHHLREKIKESHRVLHEGLHGIRMTKDHPVFIRSKIEKIINTCSEDVPPEGC